MSSVALPESGGYRACKDCQWESRPGGSGLAKHGLFQNQNKSECVPVLERKSRRSSLYTR